MSAIITWLESLVDTIFTLVKFVIWILQGLGNFLSVGLGSMNILGHVLEFLPTAVSAAIMSTLAILLTLRILGR